MRSGEVLIVGGGVAGLAVGNALARVGIPSHIFERTTHPGSLDRGDLLHISGLRRLEAWGVQPYLFHQGAIQFTTFRMLDNFGRQLLSLDISELLGEKVIFTALRHHHIETALQEAALTTGLVRISRGEACRSLVSANGRAIGIQTSRDRYDASLIVLATGSHSALRNEIFGAPRKLDYPVAFINVTCRQLSEFSDCGAYVLGTRGVLIMVPLPQGHMRIGMQLRKEGFRGIPSEHELKRMISHRLSILPVDRLEILDAHAYRISRSIYAQWWAPGVVLAGDAAHTNHPAGGQGMNLAIGDADVLARNLAGKSLGIFTEVERACRTYSQERLEKVSRVLRWTDALGRLGHLEGREMIYLREWAIRAVDALPYLKRTIFGAIVESN